MKANLRVLAILFIGINVVKAQSGKIDSLVQSYIDVQQFNGSILVRKAGFTYEKSFGYRDYKLKELNSDQSVYQIASLTKPFTATIVLMLMEKGKLSLTDPVSKYLQYPDNGVLIKHLITQSSGISDDLDIPEIREKFEKKEAIAGDFILAATAKHPLQFAPGTQFDYSNSNFFLLGKIIEKVTALSFDKALKKYITQPLKMKHTGFDFGLLKSGNKTVPYAYISKTKQRIAPVESIAYTNASGGMYSTTADIYKFYTALKDHKLLSAATFEQATTLQASDKGSGLVYGYGWFIDQLYGKPVINHGGNLEGATSSLLMLPQEDICIITLTNITSTTLETFNNNVLAILLNKPFKLAKQPIAISLDATLVKQYTGTYRFSDDYTVNISNENGIVLFQVNQQPKVVLKALSNTVFFVDDDNMRLNFKADQNGQVNLTLKQGLRTRVTEKVQ